MLQNCQGDLTKVLQETIVDFCQKNIPGNLNLEIYGLVCIGVIGSHEQAVLKIHKVVHDLQLTANEKVRLDHDSETLSQLDDETGLSRKTWKCGTCQEIFDKFCDFSTHSRELHNVYACRRCDRVFFIAADLKQHQQLHDNSMSINCQTCFKKFSTIADLEVHTRQHSVTNPNTCDISSSMPLLPFASSQNDYVSAAGELHSAQESLKNVKRTLADMETDDKHKEDTANNAHNNFVGMTGLLSPVSSSDGQAECVLKSTPVEHTTKDEDVESIGPKEEMDRTFECCSSIWLGFRSYENHFITNHSRYPCPLCRQTFTSRNNMRRHVNCNHGERRKFECPICEKHFTRPDIVKEHKLTHTKSYKSNKCSVCRFVSNKKTTLLVHLKKCLKNENIEQDISEN